MVGVWGFNVGVRGLGGGRFEGMVVWNDVEGKRREDWR